MRERERESVSVFVCVCVCACAHACVPACCYWGGGGKSFFVCIAFSLLFSLVFCLCEVVFFGVVEWGLGDMHVAGGGGGGVYYASNFLPVVQLISGSQHCPPLTCH